MDLSRETISRENLNLLRNDLIKFDCGPLVYQTILEWGFPKPKDVKIIDYINELKIQEKCGRNDKKWLKKNEKALEATDFSSFDITTLHKLLPVLCYAKVTQTGRKEYEAKLKDTNSIEYLLNEIKNFRNEVSHDSSKARKDPNIEEKQELLRKCIRTAGSLYGKDQSDIDAKVVNLDAKFEKLMLETSSYEKALRYVANKIEYECPTFMLKKYSPLFTVPLPGGLGKIDSSQIFESVNISVAVEDKNETVVVEDATAEDKVGTEGIENVTDTEKDETKLIEDATVKDESKKNKIVFSSSEIYNQVSNTFVVINGDPGSGKTTLMRHMQQNILKNSSNGSKTNCKGIDKFRVPIYLECRSEKQNNLRDFLKENLPNLKYPKDVIYDAFKEVKGKVFLIDGYDEVNDESSKLVDEIIPFCHTYKATCIVSGRVDAGNNFISKLQERKWSYDEMIIEPISLLSDKLNFLRSYADKMCDVNSKELVKSFENMKNDAQKVFFTPNLLALFISLFLKNKNSLSQLHNEHSAYKAIREIFSKDIQRKLRDSKVANPKLRTKDILAVFSKYSLLLFNNKEYFFKEDNYDKLVRDCEQELTRRDVDFEKLLTCILTPETSFKQGNTSTYAFTHSTIQEYLAVEQILENMNKSKIDWNSEQNSEESLRESFLNCLGVSDTHHVVKKEVRRYNNIIKLLILEALTNGSFTEYTKTFTAVLREYFAPRENCFPFYLLTLVSSSNCDSAIVSIVCNILRDKSHYYLKYSRHIRPLSEVLKMLRSSINISFEISESLTDTDCINIGQLISVLNDDSKVELKLKHSYYNYQPLNEEFYTQLKNIKCGITYFRACVASLKHLSIVLRAWRGRKIDKLQISTLSACDVSFAPLEGYEGELRLRVKYTNDSPITGSNPVTENTELTITNVSADGRDNVLRIIKYLSPESKQFRSILLANCHLTDTDIIELLYKLEGEEIMTEEGKRTEVKKRRVNEDKSRDLELRLKYNPEVQSSGLPSEDSKFL